MVDMKARLSGTVFAPLRPKCVRSAAGQPGSSAPNATSPAALVFSDVGTGRGHPQGFNVKALKGPFTEAQRPIPPNLGTIQPDKYCSPGLSSVTPERTSPVAPLHLMQRLAIPG